MSKDDIDVTEPAVMAPEYPYKALTDQIIGAAIEVHRELGSGFLEQVYENALQVELRARGIEFESQVQVPVRYKGKVVGSYCADLLVAGLVICEIKALDSLAPVHESQLMHHLKATGIKVDLLLNFGTKKLQIKSLTY